MLIHIVLASLASFQAPEDNTAQLEKTYQEMAARYGVSETLKHVQLGMWCQEKGLYRQMFEQFDIALKSDPAQAQVAKTLESIQDENLLRTLHVHFDRSAQPADWLKIAADSNSPSRILLARIQLSRLDSEAWTKAMVTGLLNLKEKIRIYSAQQFKEKPEPKALGPLITRSLLDPQAKVREAANTTLLVYPQDEVETTFIQALNQNNMSMRIHAAEALAALGRLKAVDFLIAAMGNAQAAANSDSGGPRAHIYTGTQVSYIRDYDVQVATAAAIAKPVIGVIQTGSVLDVRVLGIREEINYSLEVKVLRKSLVKLTGYDAGNKASSWSDWWAANRNPSGPKSGS